MDKLSQSISQTLIKYRHLSQLSQEDLADMANIHRTYVSQIERGLKMPTLAIFFKVAKALNVNPSDLLKEIEKRYNEIHS
jgi:transcriptional regulator with XRE-family HTH domain